MSLHSSKPANQLPNIRIATRTDVGLHRIQNEDSLGTTPLRDACAVVVCDGMGGHEGGAEASQIAVGLFLQTLQQSEQELRDQAVAVAMQEGVRLANSEILKAARNRGSGVVMGTTLVAGVIRHDPQQGYQLHLANVGDSRAYLFRNGGVQQLTNDHSHVAQLVASGVLTREQAAQFPGRNVITRALGSDTLVVADFFQHTMQQGDTLLLATDGLHSEIDDERIAEILRGNPQLDSACDALVVAALAAGGRDNVTVILARLESDQVPTVKDSPVTVEKDPETSNSSQRSIQRAWLWTFCVALLAALFGVYVWRGVIPTGAYHIGLSPAGGEPGPDTFHLWPSGDSSDSSNSITPPQPTPGEGLYEGN